MEDSGLYTIKNSGTGLYLGHTGDKGLFLVGLANPFSKRTIQFTDMGVMFLWVHFISVL
jgi:hypothetical protein